jgi:hypothetical protein
MIGKVAIFPKNIREGTIKYSSRKFYIILIGKEDDDPDE